MINETQEEKDIRFMTEALKEAQKAADAGEIPIGAVIAVNGRVIAKGHNLTETLNDVTAHAEMQAITAAEQYLGGKYLPECTLYVTVEPCPMCAGAIGWAQIGRVVWGAPDVKRGFSTLCMPGKTPFHPRAETVGGVLEDECREVMQKFFRKLR